MVSMNSHGIWFQAIIGMVELKGVHKTKGKLSWVTGKYTVRELILHKKSEKKNISLGNQKVGVIFLTSYLCNKTPKGI